MKDKSKNHVKTIKELKKDLEAIKNMKQSLPTIQEIQALIKAVDDMGETKRCHVCDSQLTERDPEEKISLPLFLDGRTKIISKSYILCRGCLLHILSDIDKSIKTSLTC